MTGSSVISDSALRWGALWGAGARDYTRLSEPSFRDVYERVFGATGVTSGTRLLDVGCGPGLAARLAADRGARVAGLDAAEASIAIARERTPDGDLRVGDMQDLPWPDRSFEVVTSFNAFHFADDPPHALSEARRVLARDGRLAVVVWDTRATCDMTAVADAIAGLQPASAPSRDDPFAPERLGALLERAGFEVQTEATHEARMDLADLESAVQAMLSAAPFLAAAQLLGEPAVRSAIAESLAPFRTITGTYRLRNGFYFVVGGRVA
jgi:SAM-dependent methyltransferase